MYNVMYARIYSFAEQVLMYVNRRGTVGKVHVECLNAWRAMSTNSQSFYKCDLVSISTEGAVRQCPPNSTRSQGVGSIKQSCYCAIVLLSYFVFVIAPQCGYKYNIKRADFADFLESKALVHGVASALVMLLVCISAIVVSFVALYWYVHLRLRMW